jgi:predicted esterase
MPASDFVHVFEPGEVPWTLLLLHGTGGDENDLVPLGRQLAPGANLLSPRGKVLENGVSPRFFRRLAVGELDIPDLLARTGELASFVGDAAAEYSFDRERVVAVGLSNGANIAVSLLFRHPGLLAGAALLRPMLPYEPPADLDLAGTPVLVAAGGRDPLVPSSESINLGKSLEATGATVTTHLNPSAGHGLTEGDLVETSRWLTDLIAPD